MWNLKNKIKEKIKQKLMDTEDELIVARWEESGGLVKKVEGIKKYKLAVTK